MGARLHNLGSIGLASALCAALAACGDDAKAGRDRAQGQLDAGSTPADSGLDAANDAGSGLDASGLDTGAPLVDAGLDAGKPACPPFVMPSDCTIPAQSALPSELRCTGLYDDWEKRELACGAREYEPAYALWSDGAVKRRFVILPPNTTVDVSDPDAFVYPVGTQFFKEFHVQDGQGGTRLAETRLLRKVDGGWVYTSYVWNEDASNAIQDNDGVTNLFGLGYDVPTRDQCAECHKGRSDQILGWDSIMLGAGAKGLTLELLNDEGLLTSTAGAISALTIPGNEIEKAALGYLHANCGVSCHNRNVPANAYTTGFFMRLDAGKLGSVHDTDAVVTGINETPNDNRPEQPADPASGAFVDIRPLDLTRSLTVARMNLRGEGQMPQIATNKVDDDGVAAVSAWIEAMTVQAGYPAPAP